MRASLGFPLVVAVATALVGAQQPSSDTAVSVFPFLVGNMDGRISEIVRTAEQNGIDTIYVSVFRATGPRTGDLWITDSAGDWNPAWGRVRPTGAGLDLTRLVGEAHLRGLRVVGVLKCFDASVQPTDLAHRAYLLDVVDYLVDAFGANGVPVYDLDGLGLDYVRYVQNGVGNNPAPVTAFVADVKRHLGALSLHAYLIANRYSFDGPNYDGRFRSYAQTMQILRSDFGQDWEQLARHLDVLMPMAYTADGSIYNSYALHQAYVRAAASYARTACSRGGFPFRRVQPVIKTYTSANETTTPQTVEASIKGALLGSANGFQAFRYGTIQTSWWAKVRQWAITGPNFPTPRLSVGVAGLTATLNPTASSDRDEPASGLMVRFDFGADGSFDTGWLPNSVHTRFEPAPGARRVAILVRDRDGHRSATRRGFDLGPVLTLASPTYPAIRGGPAPIRLDVGPGGAGATFLVLGSFSGSQPGTLWRPGFRVPLNLDGLTEALFLAVNSPILQNGLGSLDPAGRATAVFSVPPGVLGPFLFRGISWAAIGVDAAGVPRFVSDAALMLIVP